MIRTIRSTTTTSWHHRQQQIILVFYCCDSDPGCDCGHEEEDGFFPEAEDPPLPVTIDRDVVVMAEIFLEVAGERLVPLSLVLHFLGRIDVDGMWDGD